MNYGYVRVSTSEQNTDRQLDAMKELGIEHIYIDKFTGISFDRPNYERLRRRMKSGDVLFVKSLDRFGRKYTAVLEEWRYLAKKGVAVVVMDMPILDTRPRGGDKNLMGKFIADLVLSVLSFVAESEYRNIHERQRQGIEAAKARGVRFGRERKPIPETFWEAAEGVRKGKLSFVKGAKKAEMPQTTFWSVYQRYIKGDVKPGKEPLPICPYLKRVPNTNDCLGCFRPNCSFEDEKNDFEVREPYQPKYNPEVASKKAKERRERRIAAGLCPLCGVNPPEEGKKACRECLDKRKEYHRYKVMQKMRREANGERVLQKEAPNSK